MLEFATIMNARLGQSLVALIVDKFLSRYGARITSLRAISRSTLTLPMPPLGGMGGMGGF